MNGGGVIEDMGADVQGFHKGQRVSGEGHLVGRTSRAARAGRFHLDPDTKGIGVHVPGAFADYMVLPAFNVIALPDHVSMETAAVLDPLGNAVHAALSFDVFGEDVLITGAGPIGIMAAAVARHAGARHIVLTDVRPERLALAEKTVRKLRTVDVAQEDLNTVMTELGMKEGFDIGLEMSGSPSALRQMVDVMVMGGKIACLGLPSEPFSFDFSRFIFKALTIKGIYGREMYETWYKMLAMLEAGLDISPVITHHFDAENFEKAFEVMQSGEGGKVILSWQT